MSRASISRVAAGHAALVSDVEDIVKDHEAQQLLAIRDWRWSDRYDPEDADLKVVTVEGDRVVLRFLSGDYDNRHCGELSIPMDYLTANAARRLKMLGDLGAARDAEEARMAAEAEARAEEKARQQYEALRRRFEPTGTLRSDIKRAMEIEADEMERGS